uniref:Uncharacterized protein n=1 Tax=Meloidogyne enterolobii TaxID=390850 RepID=A0A6V7W1Y3_MELEN|nr:unnamed protein product [Meloidogyne enterolobii]
MEYDEVLPVFINFRFTCTCITYLSTSTNFGTELINIKFYPYLLKKNLFSHFIFYFKIN